MKEDLFREYLTTEISTVGTNKEMRKTYREVVKLIYEEQKPERSGAEIAKDIIDRAGLKVE